MASQPSSRKTFIDSSIKISRSYNFHGLNIDWEFPATANFGTLLAEWRGGSIKNNLDWINMMSYSFFAPGWSPNVTRPPDSLYNPISPISGDSGITAWLQAAEGMAVPPDRSAGYNLIKAYITENGAPTVFNSTLVMDYSYTGKTWIGYDDTQSITTEVSYPKEKGLVGYFAWNVGIDVNWTVSQAGMYGIDNNPFHVLVFVYIVDH
ncbi:PREDICTED: chitotriosidase-1 [Prunus dulcis]|uniref:PREDICTED: chitotriosidase-1 n=1 Tax=Prunus dulcis TaxID=3755 RepID=A0A5E4FET4_PRUDU|nr:PREDICTED: chitotriosidase-1 [Prunus dulcis]